MPARIVIPLPHSLDLDYSERAIPQYEHAVELAGGEPVRIPLNLESGAVMEIISRCDGALLPGSGADVDPAKFDQARLKHTAAADSGRDRVDELLLQDAYTLRKPVLGICYGLQSLNVYRGGSLIQHIPDFLPEALRTRVNHEAGKKVPVAHSVDIDSGSRLATIVERACAVEQSQSELKVQKKIRIPVNSSHHQSADKTGDGLRVVALCAEDGIIEAVEGTANGHFVVAVQWHPERSVDDDEHSRAIFRALVEAAEAWRGARA